MSRADNAAAVLDADVQRKGGPAALLSRVIRTAPLHEPVAPYRRHRPSQSALQARWSHFCDQTLDEDRRP